MNKLLLLLTTITLMGCCGGERAAPAPKSYKFSEVKSQSFCASIKTYKQGKILVDNETGTLYYYAWIGGLDGGPIMVKLETNSPISSQNSK